MIPQLVDRILLNAPGAVGASYQAYKVYRWGDPYIRLVASLADKSRLAIDVGAHQGDYTFFMRRYAAHCVAFECNPMLVNQLQRRFGQSVEIRSEAVSDRDGSTQLRIPLCGEGSVLGRATIEASNVLNGFQNMQLVPVRTTTLDAAVSRPVGLIKVDVEGHEMAVLRGAMRILQQDKPNLLIEIEERHAPGSVAAAFGLLESLGYRGYCLNNQALVAVQRVDLAGEGLWNYVFKYEPERASVCT